MRTKTLLIAAAALAATVISSEAQVYSANVVGYVNVTFPPGANTLVTTPLTTGNDKLTNVITGPLPGATTILFWNAGLGSFTSLTYSGPPSNRHWTDSSSVNQDNTLIPPGTAYFINCGGAGYTNTYVGSVVAASATTVTNSLNTGLLAVGSLIPYAGPVTNAAALNLIPPGATTIQLWDSVSQSYTSYTYSGPAANRTWKDSANNVVVPTLNVGQGFFISPGASYNWTQTLP